MPRGCAGSPPSATCWISSSSSSRRDGAVTRRRSTALIGDDNTVVVSGKSVTWRTLHKLPQLPSPAAVLVDNGADALAAVRHHAVHGTELLVATTSRVDLSMREELADSGFAIVIAKGDEHSVEP